jgi:hypothetical protein
LSSDTPHKSHRKLQVPGDEEAVVTDVPVSSVVTFIAVSGTTILFIKNYAPQRAVKLWTKLGGREHVWIREAAQLDFADPHEKKTIPRPYIKEK